MDHWPEGEIANRATAQLAIDEYHKQLDKRIADLQKEMNDIILRAYTGYMIDRCEPIFMSCDKHERK